MPEMKALRKIGRQTLGDNLEITSNVVFGSWRHKNSRP